MPCNMLILINVVTLVYPGFPSPIWRVWWDIKPCLTQLKSRVWRGWVTVIHPIGLLSLAIPLCIHTVSTSKSWAVNSYTARADHWTTSVLCLLYSTVHSTPMMKHDQVCPEITVRKKFVELPVARFCWNLVCWCYMGLGSQEAVDNLHPVKSKMAVIRLCRHFLGLVSWQLCSRTCQWLLCPTWGLGRGEVRYSVRMLNCK